MLPDCSAVDFFGSNASLRRELILWQIPHLRPTEYKTSRLHRHRKTVNRAYGGNLAGSAVRERYEQQLPFFTIKLSCWLCAYGYFLNFYFESPT